MGIGDVPDGLHPLDLDLGDLAFVVELEEGGHAPVDEHDGDGALDDDLLALQDGVLPLAGGLHCLEVLGESLLALMGAIPVNEAKPLISIDQPTNRIELKWKGGLLLADEDNVIRNEREDGVVVLSKASLDVLRSERYLIDHVC